ncbi:hypothetical protein LXH09_36020 [Streptomyces sp. CS7]|uniref:hypothetical protein n=1 Tax=Streptomyces sp. CS-7 TaxID=2906769 RepID=UPI0021B29199|nr:hypothetical protein [Streptomyces sp. CS-7]MCT6782037.1 hypothetical protein [Streptomyces sp. CS-7]
MKFNQINKAVAASIGAAALVAATATNAFAADTFPGTSYINNARPEFESSRWSEVAYTELRFTGCSSANDLSVSPTIYRVRNNWPDADYGEKTFTACFNGGTSVGTEDGLESGRYYFQIGRVDESQSKDNLLDVKKVVVDSTLAD